MLNWEVEDNFTFLDEEKKDLSHRTLADLRRVQGIEVAELYSMPRVTETLERDGQGGGVAYDLQLGWNFDRAQDRVECAADVKKRDPT